MNVPTSTGLKAAVLTIALAGGSALALAAPTSAGARSARATPALLPAALRPVFYQTLVKDAGAAYAVNGKGCATLPAQKLETCFDASGAHFTSAAKTLALHLTAWGRGNKLVVTDTVEPVIAGNQVRYRHGNLSEWWRVLPVGFEEGFTIEKRPRGNGELTLALTANDKADRHGSTLGWGQLRYGQLVVTDANGKVVPATLKGSGDRVLIAVNDAHAIYPLTVDPLVWLEQEVSATDTGVTLFGYSVAIDGTTALIGAPGTTVISRQEQGAAYVFTESNGVWTQTARLVAGDAAALDHFGFAVALTDTTAVIGAPDAGVAGHDEQGAVYVFAESGGNWEQKAKLTASDGAESDEFGSAVAVGGATVLAGAPYAGVNGHAAQGAAYVFGESGGDWGQTAKLTASDGAAQDNFGSSLALAGNLALVGAPQASVNGHLFQGAAYAFSQSGGNWTQVVKLTASDGTSSNNFGAAVALAGPNAFVDAYALVGAPYVKVGGNSQQGVAYVFNDSGGTWAQTARLVASDGTTFDFFGSSVALDGTTALVGAPSIRPYGPGAAYVFTASGGGWTETRKLTASDGVTGATFGYAALDHETALVGAPYMGTSGPGLAYFEGRGDLDLAVSPASTVSQQKTYVSQTIATNDASVSSPAVTATMAVPAAASFVSATATQGSCGESSGIVTCDFGAIDGNAGTATANVTLKAIGGIGEIIDNTASIVHATPALTASAPTVITACPADYLVFEGALAAGWQARSSGFRVPAGTENVILTGPPGFQLWVQIKSAKGTKTYRIPGNESHKWGPAGTYTWIAQAGDTGGSFVFCLQHP